MAKKTNDRFSRSSGSSIGGQAQSIFDGTEDIVDVEEEKADKEEEKLGEVREVVRGRPKELPADAVKSTVTFYNSQIVWLDRLSATMREKSKAVVDRSAIIRGILRGIEESGVDLSGARSEEEIRAGVLDKLKDAGEGG
jgi:hypothetical protein